MGPIESIVRRTRLLLGVCLCAAAAPRSSSAQQPVAPARLSVRGMLVDSVTHLPIPRGQVTLPETTQRVIADGSGRFEMREVAAGPRVLLFEALGYAPVVVPVVVSDTTAMLVVALQPAPIPISGLNVGAAGTPTVWGVVVDARTGKGIPYGTVWLRGHNRTGVADERGSFRLTRVPEGNDLLLASKLGYESVYVPVRAEPAADPVQVRLEPDSVVLKGLKVAARQLTTRRNAYKEIVTEYAQDKIVRAGAKDAWDFLTLWSRLHLITCQGRAAMECVAGRGGPVHVIVYIDELEMPGGLEMLKTYPVHEIYSIELFGRGDIHLYTAGFMESLARRPRLLIDDNGIPLGTSIGRD